ncbi:MAG: FHA domain-containing protein [Gammaproteobacteria bacterium]
MQATKVCNEPTVTTNVTIVADDVSERQQPVLFIRRGKEAIRRFPLEKFRLSIGRESDADIRLEEGYGASRHHAQILMLDGEVVIQDLGSRNGTFVNGKLIRGNRQRTLSHGDRITIGKYRLKFAIESVDSKSDRMGHVQRLLDAWPVAAVMSPHNVCGLCHGHSATAPDSHSEHDDDSPTSQPFEHDDQSDRTESVQHDFAADLAAETVADSSEPAPNTRFGRNLKRRAKPPPRRIKRHRAANMRPRRKPRCGAELR